MDSQDTCIDWFDNDAHCNAMKRDIVKITHHLSNSLAMLKRMKNGFPAWFTREDRKLFMDPIDEGRVDLIVAGSGHFTTITDAVNAAPARSRRRIVIYIKAGAYFENVEVDITKERLMFLGDGIGNTIIKASKSLGDGWRTYDTATVAVIRSRFIARGIAFENGADPSKGQAVALRSNADTSAFYQCSFVSHQDTLYVHSHLQFYRDFICGQAAVVFQNCNIYARKPLSRQSNTITAQSRSDPSRISGIIVFNCRTDSAVDLIPVKSEFKPYLGRPWGEYSTTIIMSSWIGDLIDPAGWLGWNDSSFALNTLGYGEYNNRGPGSNTSARVNWPGYKAIHNPEEARQYAADSFLQAVIWLHSISCRST